MAMMAAKPRWPTLLLEANPDRHRPQVYCLQCGMAQVRRACWISGVEGTRSNGSRLSRTTRQDFNYVVVIVDANRLHGAPISAVADYIAMVCLAQINPDMNTANYSTILNLFADSAVQPKPSEMTAWDVAFLGGLYHMTRNARTLAQQRDEISHYIVEAR